MTSSFDPYHRWLGIAPPEQPPHHYRLLGLSLYESDPEVIRDAAERQIAHVRSYQLGTHADVCQRILNELAAAKGCLLDADKKAAYDEVLRAEAQREVSPSAPPIVPPAPPLPIAPDSSPPASASAGPVYLVLLCLALFGLVAIATHLLTRRPQPDSAKGTSVALQQPISPPPPAPPTPKPAATQPSPKNDPPPAATIVEPAPKPDKLPPKPPAAPQVESAPSQADVERKAAVQRAAQRAEAERRAAEQQEAAKREAEQKEKDKQARLASLHEQREKLLAEIQPVQANRQSLNAQLVMAKANYDRYVGQHKAALQRLKNLEQQAAALALNPLANVDRQLTSIALTNCQSECSYLLGEVQKADSARKDLSLQLAPVEAELRRLAGEAARLRDQWVEIVDPYGYLNRGEYDPAVKLFSEWIALESGYYEPYVARGVAYRQLGKPAQADADFRAANLLDRRNAEKKRQELQRSLRPKPN